MQRIDTLPPAFARHRDIGGVLDIVVFGESRGTLDEIVAAMQASLSWYGPFDGARLQALGGRRIDQRTFLGDWADSRGNLIRRGSWRSEDGREFENPRLKALDGVKIVSGASSAPPIGAGGHFAYAFANPPYPLTAPPGDLQELFDQVCALLLPKGQTVEILDWSSRELVAVSTYFAAGLEWWGVFLFSAYVPISRRLTIIAASTTD